MTTQNQPKPELFLQSLQNYGVDINFDHRLHVMLFQGDQKTLDAVHNFFGKQPALERALLERKGYSFCGLDESDLTLRSYLYDLIAPLFEKSESSLSRCDLHAKYFWLCVIKWLSRNGGEIPNLPGAVRYVFHEDEPRIDGQEKYPASFPKGYETWYTQKTLSAL